MLFNWLPVSIRHEEYLDLRVRTIAGDLFSKQFVEDSLEKAEKFSDGYYERSRDKTWSQLINMYWMARRQLLLLDKCLALIRCSRWMKMEDKHVNETIDCFKKSMGDDISKEDLKEKISETKKLWLQVQDRIQEVRPPISFIHVFLGIKKRGGIEVSSLIVGSLVVLGAVYMSFSYEAVAGISAYKYWTVEDLILRGVLVVPFIAILWGLLEVVLLLFHISRRIKYLFCGWLVKVPGIPLFLFFSLAVIVVSLLSYMRGMDTLSKFARMNEKSAQMATVMDGTVLNNVYLVGTSDRTAIFLQAKDLKEDGKTQEFKDWQKEWRDDMQEYLDAKKKGYWKVAKHVVFPFGDKSSQSSSSSPVKKPYDMVVMDRALVICHALMNKCETPKEDLRVLINL